MLPPLDKCWIFVTWAVMPLAIGCGAEEGSVAVGDDMPALEWEGYVNEDAQGLSSEQPFVDYGTEALEATGRRYALLHTAETF
jgi:hypothetical protein